MSRSLRTYSLSRAQLLRDAYDLEYDKRFAALAAGDETALIAASGNLPPGNHYDGLPDDPQVRQSYLDVVGEKFNRLIEADQLREVLEYLKDFPALVERYFQTKESQSIALRLSIGLNAEQVASTLAAAPLARQADEYAGLMCMKLWNIF